MQCIPSDLDSRLSNLDHSLISRHSHELTGDPRSKFLDFREIFDVTEDTFLFTEEKLQIALIFGGNDEFFLAPKEMVERTS